MLDIGHAHLWLVDPAAPSTTSMRTEMESLLSAEERDRMGCYRQQGDRLNYLVAHSLTRAALSACTTGVPPDRWSFQPGGHGRPEIAGPHRSALRFNISHTDGLVACLVAAGSDCGVDVEHLHRGSDLAGLSARLLAPAERASLASAPKRRWCERFVRYWTLKEAYAKARGMGLALPFESLSFEVDRGPHIRLTVDPTLGGTGTGWQFHQWLPTPDHVVAVAIRPGPAGYRGLVVHTELPGALAVGTLTGRDSGHDAQVGDRRYGHRAR